VKATELVDLLKEFYLDKLALRQRHFAAARSVADYEFNNTYQYVIAREDVQLTWLRDALADLGGWSDQASEQNDPGVAGVTGHARKGDLHPQVEVIDADSKAAQAFVDKWRGRLDAVPNARHRGMLRVIIGETLEHKRFFDQALAGRTDLLGRRADGAGTGGGVLSVRWMEQ